ncbi:hypothetical protein HDV02_004389 [Globomyces sp. JEL0801]|nr:hypothetical protein HDV02_004389 [Globomyces sp. JEL0801]
MCMLHKSNHSSGMVGSVSLLVTSLTGPGLILIPLLYQSAGWIFPTIIFILIGIMAGVGSLFVVEAVSKFPGNEKFQFYGRYTYYVFLFILYGSLQSTNVASIIGSAQVFDSLLVTVFGATCGLGMTPKGGLYCVTEVSDSNSPFGDNYMFTTVGYIIVFLIIVPLTNMDFNDNMLLQLISLVYNGLFVLTLLGRVVARPLLPYNMPAVGYEFKYVIGQVLFSWTLANTVPSWMNVKHPSVDPKKAIWLTVAVALGLYIVTGFLGAISYPLDSSSNLLQAMYADPTLSTGSFVWISFIYILFPILTYITSIPIAMLVSKLNFLAAKVFSPGLSQFWSVYFPFLVGIPFQTGNGITYFGTYTKLAQSVLDEIEFLDLAAGIKKMHVEDDDFDYIYHLPTANPDQIIYRDPFAVKKEGIKPSKSRNLASMHSLSVNSRHSVKEIRSMLDPQKKPTIRKKGGRRQSNVHSLISFNSNGEEKRQSLANSTAIDADVDGDGSLQFSFLVPEVDDQGLVIIRDGAEFRALPNIVYRYMRPIYVAIILLVGMIIMVSQTAAVNFGG